MAALGGSLPLNPPTALYEITLDDVERAEQQLQRFLTEYAEIVKAYEYERGMGCSAAHHHGALAVRNSSDDWHHDFVTQY